MTTEPVRGQQRAALLLCSATGRYPRGDDPWVRAMVAAADHLAREGFRLVASTGLPAWELAAFLAGERGLELELVVPGMEAPARGRDLTAALGLDPGRTRLEFTGPGEPRELMLRRDRLALERAEVVFPIALRPGGRLETLLKECRDRVEVREEFRVPWPRRNWRPRYALEGARLDPGWSEQEEGWLFHWSASRAGCWPGEPPAAFYRELLACPERYVRDAAATLGKMLAEGRVRGSGWRMPGGRAAVSLTALDPAGAVPLMRWRQRWRRYTFEPFGLAIRREAVERLGGGPVAYLAPGQQPPAGADRLFFQSAGRVGDWAAEREWRLPGDLPLDRLEPGELLAVAADPPSLEKLRPKLDHRVRLRPLFRDRI